MEEAVVIQQLSQNGNKPEDWLEFLTQVQQQTSSNSLDNYSHLLSLYKKAADKISPEENVSSPAYAKILVDLAKLQAKTTNVDEARTTFQLARNNVKGFAIVFVSWAQFELDQGNRGKCRSLLRKGKQYGATPKHILQLAFANCVENKDKLLDEETEELSFTGLLTQKQNVLAECQTSEDTKCSESISPELTQGSQSSTDESTSGSHFSFKPTASSQNTKTGGSVESTVVSFKLPSVLEGYRNPTTSRRTGRSSGSSSSSSGDDADTVPFSKAVPGKYLSMSTRKPTAKSTPDCKSDLLSLAGNMNLSIRRPAKARRGLLGNKLSFGIPMRVEEEPGSEEDGHYRNSSSREVSCELAAEQQATREQSATLKQVQVPPVHQVSTPSALCEHRIPFNTCGLCIQAFQQQTPCVGQQYAYSVPQYSHSGSFLSATGTPSRYPPHSQSATPMSVPPPTAVVTNKTIMVNGKQYLQLEAIGRGGSSRVYKCFDGKKVCAVKHVNLEDADKVVVDSYINEITLLKSLQGNENVIKLFDWELNQDANAILLVMECGSIDLAGFLRKNRQQINDNDLRTYWNQMLNTVHAIHTNGIIHSDLKPANFLFVEGKLKLIDFGIANAIQGDKTSIIRDSQMGTLNYMSPEALQDTSYGSHPSSMDTSRHKPCLKIGRASDVWSLGCIMYLMVYGKTPFQHITNHIVKLQCILDPNHQIELPEIKSRHLMDTIKGCLRRDPRQRYTIPQLLNHPYISASGELPDEEQFFNCLMQFKSRHDVNSPRSIRALTKGLVKQLQTGEQIDLSEVLPFDKPSPQLFNMVSKPPQYPSHAVRQPLVGIDVQSLQHAQSSLKSITASTKYTRAAREKDMDKENADLQFILKKQIEEKYRNAIPSNTTESTFEQSWSTCPTLP